jgi:hypothetical protein
MSEILSDMDVAGAMLLIQQKQYGDGARGKLILSETGVSGSERKNDGAFVLTQPSAPDRAKRKKKPVALSNIGKGGAMVSSDFVYDNYDWQTYEVFDLQQANAPLARSPAQSSRASRASKVRSKPAAKRKITSQASESCHSQKADGKRKKGNNESNPDAGASAAAKPQHNAAPPSEPDEDKLASEIEELRRQISEHTAKLQEAKRLKKAALSDYQQYARLGNRCAAVQQPSKRANAASAMRGSVQQRQKLAQTIGNPTGVVGARRKAQHKRKKVARDVQSMDDTNFISLTRITNGGKFKFAESRDFKVHEPDDDKTIPPPRVKMADWETQVNLGQWRRLRGFTDCRRCFGHCGANHKKDDGCLAAQEVRRFKLKKHYMDIERKKVALFKQKNRKKTKEGRRQLARTMNMANKSSISNMSKKQRALLKKKKQSHHAV